MSGLVIVFGSMGETIGGESVGIRIEYGENGLFL